MNAKGRRRAVRIGSLLVLLLAVFPNALYVGHWPVFTQTAEPAEAANDVSHHHHGSSPAAAAETTGEAHERAGHCYAGPSKCSEAPGTGFFQPAVEAAVLALLAGGLLTLLFSYGRLDTGMFFRRIDEPPRRTLLASAT
jgi:hypothetical protein